VILAVGADSEMFFSALDGYLYERHSPRKGKQAGI
jgi:hypothetical protein